MGINQWNAEDRPREKLATRGATALTDAELLAICLRTGVRGKSAIDLARQLLDRFGGIRRLLNASRQEVCSIAGLGPAKYAQLQCIGEINRRFLRETLAEGISLTSPTDTEAFLIAHLRDYPHEVFACLFLDNKHRILAFEEMFRGTINGASVHSREIVKAALAHNAAALIFAHNHPSGVAEPSSADLSITRRLTDALALVDIQVLDHIIIGNGKTVSFAQRGLL